MLYFYIFLIGMFAGYLIEIYINKNSHEDNCNECNEKFTHIFNSSPIGIAFVRNDGHFMEVNSTFASMLGYSAAQMRKLTFQAITHPEDIGADEKLLQRVKNNEIEGYDMKKRYFHKNGSIIWIHLFVTTIKRGKNKRHICYVAQVINMTEQRALYELAHLKEERLVNLQAKLDKQEENLCKLKQYTRELKAYGGIADG